MYKPKKTAKEDASQIIRENFGKDSKFHEIVSVGTLSKNYSFVIKESGESKYFLKLHGKGKPLKEKRAIDFYSLNKIVNTPDIFSIGEDYTITFFESNLEEANFQNHVLNLARFHNELIKTDHKQISVDPLFSSISREQSFKLINSNKNFLENFISYDKFHSLFSNLPDPETFNFESCLIHGDPHRQNLLIKENESFFLDLEHTFYARPTLDLARLIFGYPTSELENILALYTSVFERLPGHVSLKELVGIMLSDILFVGASTVIICHLKKSPKKLTQRWIDSFKNYLIFLSEQAV